MKQQTRLQLNTAKREAYNKEPAEEILHKIATEKVEQLLQKNRLQIGTSTDTYLPADIRESSQPTPTVTDHPAWPSFESIEADRLNSMRLATADEPCTFEGLHRLLSRSTADHSSQRLYLGRDSLKKWDEFWENEFKKHSQSSADDSVPGEGIIAQIMRKEEYKFNPNAPHMFDELFNPKPYKGS